MWNLKKKAGEGSVLNAQAASLEKHLKLTGDSSVLLLKDAQTRDALVRYRYFTRTCKIHANTMTQIPVVYVCV